MNWSRSCCWLCLLILLISMCVYCSTTKTISVYNGRANWVKTTVTCRSIVCKVEKWPRDHFQKLKWKDRFCKMLFHSWHTGLYLHSPPSKKEITVAAFQIAGQHFCNGWWLVAAHSPISSICGWCWLGRNTVFLLLLLLLLENILQPPVFLNSFPFPSVVIHL